jgi:hypothetical protein
MSPQQKENVTITWRVIALALLSWWGYELREIKVEIRQSSDFRIQQIEINKLNDERHKDFKSAINEVSVDVKELKVRYYEIRKMNL